MTNNPTLHLIVGKWRTPYHSNKKEFDDSHKVKKEILKKVGKKKFENQVGSNPDLDINENGVIILKGTGEYKRRPYYVTDISADDHFILRFIPLAESQEVEIQILTLDQREEANKVQLNLISHFNHLLIIPNDEDLIFSVVDRLTEEYLSLYTKQPIDFIIILSDLKNSLRNEN